MWVSDLYSGYTASLASTHDIYDCFTCSQAWNWKFASILYKLYTFIAIDSYVSKLIAIAGI